MNIHLESRKTQLWHLLRHANFNAKWQHDLTTHNYCVNTPAYSAAQSNCRTPAFRLTVMSQVFPQTLGPNPLTPFSSSKGPIRVVFTEQRRGLPKRFKSPLVGAVWELLKAPSFKEPRSFAQAPQTSPPPTDKEVSPPTSPWITGSGGHCPFCSEPRGYRYYPGTLARSHSSSAIEEIYQLYIMH